MRPFSRKFSDGALVHYALRDSAGVITINGVGTYNSAGNTITRSDVENDDGTTTDKNPASNIALSAGSHTISCDVTDRDLDRGISRATQTTGYLRDVFNASHGSVSMVADTIYFSAIFIPERTVITSAGITIIAGAGGTKLRVAIYSVRNDGSNRPDQLLIETADIPSNATGYDKIASTPITLQRGLYLVAIISDGTPLVTAGKKTDGVFPYFGAGAWNSSAICLKLAISAGWTSLPSDLSASSFSFETTTFPLGSLI